MAVRTGNFGIVDKEGNIVFSPRSFTAGKKSIITFFGKHGIPADKVTEEYRDFGEYKLVPECTVPDLQVSFPESGYRGIEIFYDDEKKIIAKRRKKVLFDVGSVKKALLETVEKDKKEIEEETVMEAGPYRFLLNDKLFSDLAFCEGILSRNIHDTAFIVDAEGMPIELTKTQFVGLYKKAFELRQELLSELKTYLENQAQAGTMEECVNNRNQLKLKTKEILKNKKAKLGSRRKNG